MNHKSIIPAQFSSFSRKGKALLTLVPLLLLGACDKENDTDVQQPGDPQKIRIEITQATATPSDTSPQTRVATDLTTCESTWTNGDKVGLYIVKGTAPLKPNGNWVDNMPMEYNSGSWTYTLPTDREYYPTGGEQLHFYAYYPYDTTLDPTDITFTVQTDQSTAAGFASSYFMTATTTGVTPRTTPVSLTFGHKLAMVKVTVANDELGVPNRVTLKGMKPTASLSLANETMNATGTSTDINLRNIDGAWYTLVPPQAIAQGNPLFTFGWDTPALIFTHTAGESVQFLPGEVKPYDITVQITLRLTDEFFPDANFRVALAAALGINQGDPITRQKIDGLTKLTINGYFDPPIANMTGIEHFTALTWLDCYNHPKLTTLDVSALTALEVLLCDRNKLSTLDVSTLTSLTALNCSDNTLSTLDVPKNKALQRLYCDQNNLSTLNVSENKALTLLECYDNNLSTLDVSKNKALEVLHCNNNPTPFTLYGFWEKDWGDFPGSIVVPGNGTGVTYEQRP